MLRASVLLTVLALAAGSSAQAAIQVVGTSLATACSTAAFDGDSSPTALQTCSRSINEEVVPLHDRAATHVNRGILLMRNRNFSAALDDFQRAVELQPDLGEAYANRGSALVVEGRFQEAIADFDRALALGLQQPERTYFNRAVAREWVDDYKGAYLDYRKAAQLNPEWPTPREQMVRFTVVTSQR
jgi:tetratricopeptide (TPR) repeat protein